MRLFIMIWSHYPDIESIRRLRHKGDELIGKKIYITEKRDGSNISLWYDKTWNTYLNMLNIDDAKEFIDKNIHISSHNLINVGDRHIVKNLIKTTSYKGLVEYIKKMHNDGKDVIVYGELMQVGKTPTQIESPIETPEFLLFDILDTSTKRFLPFEDLEKISSDHGIKMVGLIEIFIPSFMDELKTKILFLMEWCSTSHREGIVGKIYDGQQVMFKEKVVINITRRPKIKSDKPDLPPMDEHTITRAMQHAYDEVIKIAGDKNIQPKDAWADRKITMPIVAKHLELEAAEHGFSKPNAYNIYLNTPVESIQAS